MIELPPITYSSKSTWKSCRFKWYLRNIRQIQKSGKSYAPWLGSTVHAALRARSLGMSLDYCIGLIEGLLPNLGSDETELKIYRQARAIMTGYFAKYGTRDQWEVLGTEEAFNIDVRGVPFEGKTDLVVRLPSGELCIPDHKTRSELPANAIDELWMDDQLVGYAMAAEAKHGEPVTSIVYDVIVKSNISQKSGESQESFEKRLAGYKTEKTIEKHKAAGPRPGETDEEFEQRLGCEYVNQPERFERIFLYIGADRKREVVEDIIETRAQQEDAARRNAWQQNRQACFGKFGMPCEYLPYCSSGQSPVVEKNLYEPMPANAEVYEDEVPF